MNLIAVDKYIEMKNKTKILDTSCPIYAVIVCHFILFVIEHKRLLM